MLRTFVLYITLIPSYASISRFSFLFLLHVLFCCKVGLDKIVNEKGCLQAGEEWLEHNLLTVAGIAVGIAFLQVEPLDHLRCLQVEPIDHHAASSRYIFFKHSVGLVSLQLERHYVFLSILFHVHHQMHNSFSSFSSYRNHQH